MGMDVADQLALVTRVAVGLLLGAIVGWEREMQREQAGFRTYALIGLGAAMFTTLSQFAFGAANQDATRIATGIVTGVGFLGAGAILRDGGAIRGMSTAASIWAVAAVGMASGAGLYVLAISATALIVFTLEILDRVERGMKSRLERRVAARMARTPMGDGPQSPS